MTRESAIIYAGRYYNCIAAILILYLYNRETVRSTVNYFRFIVKYRTLLFIMIGNDENYIKDYYSVLNYKEIVILFVFKYNLFYI